MFKSSYLHEPGLITTSTISKTDLRLRTCPHCTGSVSVCDHRSSDLCHSIRGGVRIIFVPYNLHHPCLKFSGWHYKLVFLHNIKRPHLWNNASSNANGSISFCGIWFPFFSYSKMILLFDWCDILSYGLDHPVSKMYLSI